MKIKKTMLFLAIFLIATCLPVLTTTVNAVTISNDGQYTVVFYTETGDINGESHQAVKIDFDENEETVQISEISKGINPFSGYEFLGWKAFTSSGYETVTEISKSNFSDYIEVDGTRYNNAIIVEASYDTNKPIKNSGTYYITLDGFAGTINGKSTLKIEQKSSEFKTVDLTQYKAVREDCIFVGWDYNGSIVKSITKSDFSKGDAITIQAVYKATNPSDITEDDIVLKLDGNGGKIDGQDSKLYYYLAGKDSGTSMSLLPYNPTRDGYTFSGWNTKADGTGNNKKYIFWGEWGAWDTNKGVENAITLYANWTKNSETPTTPNKPEEPIEDTVKEIVSTGETKANIEFADGINKEYKLDIQKVEVKKELADKNVKFIADINVLDGTNIVKISDTKMKIRIAMPEDLKGYNKYEVVYILNDEIKETIPATAEDGYIVFETSHLSQYGIVATNVVENETNNPKTADNIMTNVMLLVVSITAIGTLTVVNRKKFQK